MMRRFLRDNGLSITMFGLFLAFLLAQSLTGWVTTNGENEAHNQPTVTYVGYLTSGAFVEATFENWESEFLQMGAYVLLTAFLIQRGSPESKKPGDEEADAEPRSAPPDAPWPVRHGGLILRFYENSLSIALFTLFGLSFVLHVLGGRAEYNHQQVQHGGTPVSVGAFMTSSEFWFQSFQNWQSEFLAVGALAVLGIFLRQRGSPESKPVAAPHSETGNS